MDIETPCYYPSYENAETQEFIKDKHTWGKDGFCIICGEKQKITEDTPISDIPASP